MRRTFFYLAPILAIVVAAASASARSAKAGGQCDTSCAIHDTMDPMPSMSGMSSMSSMSGMGSMGNHMTLTDKWAPRSGDAERAAQIVGTLRAAIAKYQDYRVAEQDGYMPFHTEIKQQQYHFVNYANAAAAAFAFDASKPTALLYAPDGDGYRLIGAMYTAPRSASLADLNARVPLSIAQWHEHTNFCKGPQATPLSDYVGPDARFGLEGSISTADACQAAGGSFAPVIYNWMVHAYPFETDSAQIWKVSH